VCKERDARHGPPARRMRQRGRVVWSRDGQARAAWVARLTSAIGLLLLAVGPTGASAADPPAEAIRAALAALVRRAAPGMQLSIMVADADSGATWFAHEASRPLKPASVQKLFVSAACLRRFGPEFGLETRLYLSADELWVLGGGDPGLGDERLERRHGTALPALFDAWAAALTRRGVERLSKLVLDDTIFDQEVRHADWPTSQAQSWYQAPSGGLNLNDNCLDLRVVPAGGDVRLELRPALPDDFIRNTLRPGPAQEVRLRRAVESDVFVLSGTVTRAESLAPITVGQPTVFFGHALKQALRERGVEVTGPVVRRRLDARRMARESPLAVQRTDLRDALWRCNTFSQNVFADCLLKSLAAYDANGQRAAEPGSWERGVDVLRETLQQIGLDPASAVFRDGSGLSHRNRSTAELIVRLLVLMRRTPEAAPFEQSLARPGQPGTMQRRFADPVLNERLIGKTGTLQGVQTLAGYVRRGDGTTLAFAVLMNDNLDTDLPVRVCRILAGP
jgi:D-alanyl-D-alanine carboxypeptidase/D-alanyl-D-alanine-endopeptidase (penicillin-binding protein 4)